MGFGPRPGDLAAFDARGSDDDARLRNYVDEQLNPESLPDPELSAKLTATDFTTLEKPLTRLWAEHVGTEGDWEYRMRPLFETTRAAFLRAVYSRRQLVEVLADFWHTHFSVRGYHFDAGAGVRALRPRRDSRPSAGQLPRTAGSGDPQHCDDVLPG